MVDAHRYVRNKRIHDDLKIEQLKTHMAKLNAKFYTRALNRDTDFKNSLDYELLKQDAFIRPFAAYATSDAILSQIR